MKEIKRKTYNSQQAFAAEVLHQRKRFSLEYFEPVFNCQRCVIWTTFLWVTLQQLLPQTLFTAVQNEDCINPTNLHMH